MWAWGIPRYAAHAANVYNEGVAETRKKLTMARIDRFLSFISENAYANQFLLMFLGLLGIYLIFNRRVADAMTETVLLSHAPEEFGGMCLDGSPPVYHLSAGSNSKKWMIFHEGGDWCSQLLVVDNPVERDSWSCQTRANTDKGSSRFHTSGFSFSGFASRFGYLSRDLALNPLMHDWNHVMLPYCDGASFSGEREDSHEVSGRVLHFRGGALLRAVMHDLLQNKGLVEASEVVLVGASAGGLSVLLQADTWTDTINQASRSAGRSNPPAVVALVDGGFFPEVQVNQRPCNFVKRMRMTQQIHNVTSATFRACANQHPKHIWRCMFAQSLAPHVRTPLFALVSAYDGWQLEYQLCHSDLRDINEYGDMVRVHAVQSYLGRPSNAIFLDACRHHTKCWNDIVIDGDTPATAFSRWYRQRVVSTAGVVVGEEQKRVWMQKDKYGNSKCEGFHRPNSCEVGRLFRKRPPRKAKGSLVGSF